MISYLLKVKNLPRFLHSISRKDVPHVLHQVVPENMLLVQIPAWPLPLQPLPPWPLPSSLPPHNLPPLPLHPHPLHPHPHTTTLPGYMPGYVGPKVFASVCFRGVYCVFMALTVIYHTCRAKASKLNVYFGNSSQKGKCYSIYVFIDVVNWTILLCILQLWRFTSHHGSMV